MSRERTGPSPDTSCAPPTLGLDLRERLDGVLSILGQNPRRPSAIDAARVLSRGWEQRASTAPPAWASDITDDHTPFEFSVAFGAGSDSARLLTEPRPHLDPTLQASWALASEMHGQLTRQWGADLTQLHRVAHLFAPQAASKARFCIWHSAVFGEAKPDFKVYLNPAIHGEHGSHHLVGEALQRLGYSSAWSSISSLEGAGTRAVYFSIDLVPIASARCKIYLAPGEPTAASVSETLGRFPGFRPAVVERLMQHFLGGPGPYSVRPPLLCFALRNGAPTPHSVTVHLPVRCYGARDDWAIAKLICSHLTFAQRVRYLRLLTAFSKRPLDTGKGVQTYVSLRATPGSEALTVYLAPEAYAATSHESQAATQAFPFFRASRGPVAEAGSA